MQSQIVARELLNKFYSTLFTGCPVKKEDGSFVVTSLDQVKSLLIEKRPGGCRKILRELDHDPHEVLNLNKNRKRRDPPNPEYVEKMAEVNHAIQRIRNLYNMVIGSRSADRFEIYGLGKVLAEAYVLFQCDNQAAIRQHEAASRPKLRIRCVPAINQSQRHDGAEIAPKSKEKIVLPEPVFVSGDIRRIKEVDSVLDAALATGATTTVLAGADYPPESALDCSFPWSAGGMTQSHICFVIEYSYQKNKKPVSLPFPIKACSDRHGFPAYSRRLGKGTFILPKKQTHWHQVLPC